MSKKRLYTLIEHMDLVTTYSNTLDELELYNGIDIHKVYKSKRELMVC